ncbi:MAG: hypothetical protein GF350_07745 [Chitinivibrionales bacterium]|nr:hypothetical protein [Chitinivibrionales bacterium]
MRGLWNFLLILLIQLCLSVPAAAGKFIDLDPGDSIEILGICGHSIQLRETGGFTGFFDRLNEPLGAYYNMVPRIHSEQTDEINTDMIVPGYEHYVMVGSTSPTVYFSGSWKREYEGAVDKFNEIGVPWAWVFKQYEIRDSSRARDTATIRLDMESRLATYGGRAIPVSMLQALVINRFDNDVKIILADGIHGTDICAYTWALMFYCYLTNESPEGKSTHTPNTPSGFMVTSDDLVWMQQKAWEVWQVWEQGTATSAKSAPDRSNRSSYLAIMQLKRDAGKSGLQIRSVTPTGQILPLRHPFSDLTNRMGPGFRVMLVPGREAIKYMEID